MVLSSCPIIFQEERAGCFTVIVFLLLCAMYGCQRSVSRPRGVVHRWIRRGDKGSDPPT